MVAFTYRMSNGIPGDVNRTHPCSITPNVNDSTNPATFYGQAVVFSSTGTVRTVLPTDTSLTTIAGVTVRPFPAQQQSGGSFGAETFGNDGLAPANALDVLNWGYIMVTVNGQVTKGGPVYVWIAASTGSHVQGGFEAQPTSGSTIQVTNAYWNSQAGPDGTAELAFNV